LSSSLWFFENFILKSSINLLFISFCCGIISSPEKDFLLLFFNLIPPFSRGLGDLSRGFGDLSLSFFSFVLSSSSLGLGDLSLGFGDLSLSFFFSEDLFLF